MLNTSNKQIKFQFYSLAIESIKDDNNAERIAKSYFEKHGYTVLYSKGNTSSILKLGILKKTILNPEILFIHGVPDLFVYKSDNKKDYFFVEVKAVNLIKKRYTVAFLSSQIDWYVQADWANIPLAVMLIKFDTRKNILN